MVHVAPDAAGGDANPACGWIDADPFHRRQVDDKPAVTRAQAAAIVTAAANRGQHVVGAGIVHGGDHVRHIDAAHDERGALVDHPVVDHTSGFVRLVVWPDDGAANAGT